MSAWPADLPGRVLYEDNHLLAVNKRCGEMAQGDRTGDQPLPEALKAWIKERDAKPGNVFLGVAHRLDRPTSGVLLFAKTSKALARLNRTFRERSVQKTYWAVVARLPEVPEGRLVHHLRKDPVRNKSFVVAPGTEGSREARLTWRALARIDRYALLAVTLETGRHHQIRAQLAAVGAPIRGDLKYGAPRSNPDGGISLHARELVLDHPVQKVPLRLVADPPDGDPVWGPLQDALGA